MSRALGALLAAGKDGGAQARGRRERRDGLDMLARENFGRRHQRRLLAGFGDGGGGEQRDDGLSGTDIALQQPQHPHRLLEIVRDRSGRLLLGERERIGQGVDHLGAQMPVTGMAQSGRPPQLRAHQRQRQLPGQQFVVGQPRPERPIRQNVSDILRDVDARQRLLERRKALRAPAHPARSIPAASAACRAQARLRGASIRSQDLRSADRPDRSAVSLRETLLVDDAIGMDHLQRAVEHLHGARHVTHCADRKLLLDKTRPGAKVGQHDIAGIVAGVDQMRRARAVRRRRAMAVDRDARASRSRPARRRESSAAIAGPRRSTEDGAADRRGAACLHGRADSETAPSCFGPIPASVVIGANRALRMAGRIVSV